MIRNIYVTQFVLHIYIYDNFLKNGFVVFFPSSKNFFRFSFFDRNMEIGDHVVDCILTERLVPIKIPMTWHFSILN